MCCPTEKVKTRTCGRACTEGHPLGTLVFHTQCSQPMTTSPGTVWHCLPWPTECVQMDRRLLQMLAARESLSLLAWPQPVLSPSITVLAQATYPSGSRSGASLLPEGSELSEDDIWGRTLPLHRFPGTGQQQGPSCWFVCLPAALSPCLRCAPLRTSIQGAYQPHSLPSIPQCAWSHASFTRRWEPAINPLQGQQLRAGAGCWGGRMTRRRMEQKPAKELE